MTVIKVSISTGCPLRTVGRYHLKRLYTAIRGNNGPKLDAAFAANLLHQCWIDGLDAMDQHRRLKARHTDAPRRLRPWFGRRRRLTPAVGQINRHRRILISFSRARNEVRWSLR